MENQNNPQKPESKGLVKGFLNIFAKQPSFPKKKTSTHNTITPPAKDQTLGRVPSSFHKSKTLVKQVVNQEDEKLQLEEEIARKQVDEAIVIDKEVKIKLKEVLESHKGIIIKRASGMAKSGEPTSIQSTELTNLEQTKGDSRKFLFSKVVGNIQGAQTNSENHKEDKTSSLHVKNHEALTPKGTNKLRKVDEEQGSQDSSDNVRPDGVTLQENSGIFSDSGNVVRKSKFASPMKTDNPAGNKHISFLKRIFGHRQNEESRSPSPNQVKGEGGETVKDHQRPSPLSTQNMKLRRSSTRKRNSLTKKEGNGVNKNNLLIIDEPESPAKIGDHENMFSDAKAKRRKEKMYLFFNAPHSSKSSLLYNIIILVLYVSESALIVMETDTSLDLPNDLWVKTTKYFLCIYFLEYILRLSCYNAFDETFLEFFKKSGNTVDLLAMIYTGFEMFFYEFGDYTVIPPEVKMLRALTILRWIRGFRFSVFNRGRKILSEGLSQSKKPLSILAFFAFLMVICFASLMFTIEVNSLSEEDKKNALTEPIDTIPQAIWWAIITVTTVGYGDTIPLTFGGKILSLFALLFGVIVILAINCWLKLAIMGNKFQDVYLSHKNNMTKKQRKMMKERVDDPKISKEEKEIFKIIVMLNELEEINENIEKHLRNNKFLYRSITRDALNLISKIELTNKASQLQQVAEDNPHEIVANIRRSIHKRRRGLSTLQQNAQKAV